MHIFTLFIGAILFAQMEQILRIVPIVGLVLHGNAHRTPTD